MLPQNVAPGQPGVGEFGSGQTQMEQHGQGQYGFTPSHFETRSVAAVGTGLRDDLGQYQDSLYSTTMQRPISGQYPHDRARLPHYNSQQQSQAVGPAWDQGTLGLQPAPEAGFDRIDQQTRRARGSPSASGLVIPQPEEEESWEPHMWRVAAAKDSASEVHTADTAVNVKHSQSALHQQNFYGAYSAKSPVSAAFVLHSQHTPQRNIHTQQDRGLPPPLTAQDPATANTSADQLGVQISGTGTGSASVAKIQKPREPRDKNAVKKPKGPGQHQGQSLSTGSAVPTAMAAAPHGKKRAMADSFGQPQPSKAAKTDSSTPAGRYSGFVHNNINMDASSLPFAAMFHPSDPRAGSQSFYQMAPELRQYSSSNMHQYLPQHNQYQSQASTGAPNALWSTFEPQQSTQNVQNQEQFRANPPNHHNIGQQIYGTIPYDLNASAPAAIMNMQAFDAQSAFNGHNYQTDQQKTVPSTQALEGGANELADWRNSQSAEQVGALFDDAELAHMEFPELDLSQPEVPAAAQIDVPNGDLTQLSNKVIAADKPNGDNIDSVFNHHDSAPVQDNLEPSADDTDPLFDEAEFGPVQEHIEPSANDAEPARLQGNLVSSANDIGKSVDISKPVSADDNLDRSFGDLQPATATGTKDFPLDIDEESPTGSQDALNVNQSATNGNTEVFTEFNSATDFDAGANSSNLSADATAQELFPDLFPHLSAAPLYPMPTEESVQPIHLVPSDPRAEDHQEYFQSQDKADVTKLHEQQLASIQSRRPIGTKVAGDTDDYLAEYLDRDDTEAFDENVDPDAAKDKISAVTMLSSKEVGAKVATEVFQLTSDESSEMNEALNVDQSQERQRMGLPAPNATPCVKDIANPALVDPSQMTSAGAGDRPQTAKQAKDQLRRFNAQQSKSLKSTVQCIKKFLAQNGAGAVSMITTCDTFLEILARKMMEPQMNLNDYQREQTVKEYKMGILQKQWSTQFCPIQPSTKLFDGGSTAEDNLCPLNDPKNASLSYWQQTMVMLAQNFDSDTDKFTKSVDRSTKTTIEGAIVKLHLLGTGVNERRNLMEDLKSWMLGCSVDNPGDLSQDEKTIYVPRHPMLRSANVAGRDFANPINYPGIKSPARDLQTIIGYELRAWFHLKEKISKFHKRMQTKETTLATLKKTAMGTSQALRGTGTSKKRGDRVRATHGLVTERDLAQKFLNENADKITRDHPKQDVGDASQQDGQQNGHQDVQQNSQQNAQQIMPQTNQQNVPQTTSQALLQIAPRNTQQNPPQNSQQHGYTVSQQAPLQNTTRDSTQDTQQHSHRASQPAKLKNTQPSASQHSHPSLSQNTHQYGYQVSPKNQLHSAPQNGRQNTPQNAHQQGHRVPQQTLPQTTSQIAPQNASQNVYQDAPQIAHQNKPRNTHQDSQQVSHLAHRENTPQSTLQKIPQNGYQTAQQTARQNIGQTDHISPGPESTQNLHTKVSEKPIEIMSDRANQQSYPSGDWAASHSAGSVSTNGPIRLYNRSAFQPLPKDSNWEDQGHYEADVQISEIMANIWDKVWRERFPGVEFNRAWFGTPMYESVADRAQDHYTHDHARERFSKAEKEAQGLGRAWTEQELDKGWAKCLDEAELQFKIHQDRYAGHKRFLEEAEQQGQQINDDLVRRCYTQARNSLLNKMADDRHSLDVQRNRVLQLENLKREASRNGQVLTEYDMLKMHQKADDRARRQVAYQAKVHAVFQDMAKKIKLEGKTLTPQLIEYCRGMASEQVYAKDKSSRELAAYYDKWLSEIAQQGWTTDSPEASQAWLKLTQERIKARAKHEAQRYLQNYRKSFETEHGHQPSDEAFAEETKHARTAHAMVVDVYNMARECYNSFKDPTDYDTMVKRAIDIAVRDTINKYGTDCVPTPLPELFAPRLPPTGPSEPPLLHSAAEMPTPSAIRESLNRSGILSAGLTSFNGSTKGDMTPTVLPSQSHASPNNGPSRRQEPQTSQTDSQGRPILGTDGADDEDEFELVYSGDLSKAGGKRPLDFDGSGDLAKPSNKRPRKTSNQNHRKTTSSNMPPSPMPGRAKGKQTSKIAGKAASVQKRTPAPQHINLISPSPEPEPDLPAVFYPSQQRQASTQSQLSPQQYMLSPTPARGKLPSQGPGNAGLPSSVPPGPSFSPSPAWNTMSGSYRAIANPHQAPCRAPVAPMTAPMAMKPNASSRSPAFSLSSTMKPGSASFSPAATQHSAPLAVRTPTGTHASQGNADFADAIQKSSANFHLPTVFPTDRTYPNGHQQASSYGGVPEVAGQKRPAVNEPIIDGLSRVAKRGRLTYGATRSANAGAAYREFIGEKLLAKIAHETDTWQWPGSQETGQPQGSQVNDVANETPALANATAPASETTQESTDEPNATTTSLNENEAPSILFDLPDDPGTHFGAATEPESDLGFHDPFKSRGRSSPQYGRIDPATGHDSLELEQTAFTPLALAQFRKQRKEREEVTVGYGYAFNGETAMEQLVRIERPDEKAIARELARKQQEREQSEKDREWKNLQMEDLVDMTEL